MQDFKRDRYGRPLVLVDGKETPYTRISSYGQVLEDQTGLNRWKLRTVVAGVAQRPDLVALATSNAHDSSALDKLAEKFLEAGGASNAANTGTAIHEVLAQLDTGRMDLDAVPDPFMAHAVAWQQCLIDFGFEVVPELVEIPLVNDVYQAAGSSDNFVLRTADDMLVVIDKKTGKSISNRPLAYMVQLALYATSQQYDIETGSRIAFPKIDLNVGYIAHVPANGDTCTLYEVDIQQALDLCDLAQRIKRAQKTTKGVTAAKPAGQVERDLLIRRIEAIKDAGHASLLVALWPDGVPTFKASKQHTPAQLQEIQQAVESVEREHEMPFLPEPKKPKPQPAPRLQKPKVKIEIDEGPNMDKPTIDFLRKHIKAQPERVQRLLAQWAKEASHAGHSISLSAKPSERRFEIARLMLALASHADPDQVLSAYIETQPTVGGTIALFTTKQAHDLCAKLQEANNG